MKRPECDVPNCTNRAQNTKTTANPYWRKSKWVREKFGVENGYVCMDHHCIKYGMLGWEYKKYRGTKCGNRDGRLGFKCTAVIRVIAMLTVDHIDENHENNDPKNLQDLCHNCHQYKTHLVKNKFWDALKIMIKYSGKDCTQIEILNRWKEKYA